MTFQTTRQIFLQILWCSIIIVTGFNSNGQADLRKNVLSVEALGVGYFLSAQYERVLFQIDSTNYSMRISAGSHVLDNYTDRPLSFSTGVLRTSTWRKNYVDFGIGVSYIKGLDFTKLNTSRIPTSALYLSPSLGIRSYSVAEGLVTKLYFSPLFKLHQYSKPVQSIFAFGGKASNYPFYMGLGIGVPF